MKTYLNEEIGRLKKLVTGSLKVEEISNNNDEHAETNCRNDLPTLVQLSDDDSTSDDEDWNAQDDDNDKEEEEEDDNDTDDDNEDLHPKFNMPPKGFNYIRCMYTNADSLTNKIDKLKIRVQDECPDVISVVETHCQ